jgi:predicted transcriptional regulator
VSAPRESTAAPRPITILLSCPFVKAARILRHARRRAGLSQRELAIKAGVPQPAIARIERGTVSPRVSTLDRLLQAAGFTLDVAPRLGDGVDRTLIRASLGRSPEDRIRAAAIAQKNLKVMFDAARSARA